MAAEIEFNTSVIFLTFLINLSFPFDPNEESEGVCLGVAGLAGWAGAGLRRPWFSARLFHGA